MRKGQRFGRLGVKKRMVMKRSVGRGRVNIVGGEEGEIWMIVGR